AADVEEEEEELRRRVLGRERLEAEEEEAAAAAAAVAAARLRLLLRVSIQGGKARKEMGAAASQSICRFSLDWVRWSFDLDWIPSTAYSSRGGRAGDWGSGS
ncbi:unnamed protein product, partial [Urochloa humidicola]